MPHRPFARALPLLAVLAACTDQPSGPGPGPEPGPPAAPLPALGVYRFTLAGINGVRPPGSAQLSPPAAPVLALSPVSGSLEYELVTQSSFVEGTRDAGGHRYFTFTYRVRNATGAPVSNVTLVPVMTSETMPGTAITSLTLFDGSPADPTLAPRVVPTGAVGMGEDLEMRALHVDVLQAFEEAELPALPAGVDDALPYGFVVRNPATPGSRTLPAADGPNDFAGLVTFAFRMPLHPGGVAQDPFAITFLALAIQDSETRMTESIEEGQDTSAVRRIRARATQLGVTTTTVLAGSTVTDPSIPDYPGQRQICQLRTAGSGGDATFVTAPAGYVKLVLLRPGEAMDACAASFRSGAPGRPATNVPFPVEVTAVDRYGNVIAAADTVRLRTAAGGPPAGMDAPEALSGGTVTLEVTYTDYGSSLLGAVGRRNHGWQPITVAGVTRVWTAGAATTDWHTGGNWQLGAVPMQLDSVLIPAAAPLFPVLANNVSIAGVEVENAATISLGGFNLTASASVRTGTSGGIDGTAGQLFLTGFAQTVSGVTPRTRVEGTYSLDGNLTSRAPLRVQSGRLRTQGFRIRVLSF